MNSYRKYCPNVFVAECDEQHEKGDVITIVTRHGKENEHVIHNLLGKNGDKYYYSITRLDGYNSQERARQKVEKLHGYADNAESRSNGFADIDKSTREFLSLGEPIKVGHHSEKKHRALIEKVNRRMDHAVEESKKADRYRDRTLYWEAKAHEINLSMPESLGYYKYKLDEAEEVHQGMKDGSIPKMHSYALAYARKQVNETRKKYETALKLWG